MHASSAVAVPKRETAHRMFRWAALAPSARLERATLCSASKCSIQLSYEGVHATPVAPPAGREGFEPSVEALQPRQALSRRPRSATPAPPLTGTTWPRWVLSRPSSLRSGRQAEGEGFEPPVGCPTAVFKTAALDHSAIPPGTSAPLPSRPHSTMRPEACQRRAPASSRGGCSGPADDAGVHTS